MLRKNRRTPSPVLSEPLSAGAAAGADWHSPDVPPPPHVLVVVRLRDDSTAYVRWDPSGGHYATSARPIDFAEVTAWRLAPRLR